MKTKICIYLLMGMLLMLNNSCKKVDMPILSTNDVSDITETTATCGGEITNEGGADINERGVCWSTSPNPTTSGSKTVDGTGSGIFTSAITGLAPGTTYYVRAYATNSEGTAYGNEVKFQPIAGLPTLSTTAVSSITANTAMSGGNVISDGGTSVIARGVCWSTSPNPTTSGNKTMNGTGTGVFSSNITGLSPNTTYYVRAYATNSIGTAYGNELSFTTGTLLPVLTTNSVTSITSTTAISGGNVTSDGGANVTARGVCWSTSPNPTTSGNKTINGTGTGVFSSNITLSPNTTYYIRAYATNSVGTAYGNELSYASIPVLTTTAVSSITSTTAISGGYIYSSGSANITARGVCWSTSPNPTIVGNKTMNGTGAGSFTSNMTGLLLATTYYVRAYATNSGGTAYGNEVFFITVPAIGDSYQGGKIAYILQSGDPGYNASVRHGLIAAPSDQSTSIFWDNGSSVTTGATATALGTGNANTNTIVNILGAGSYAAKLCYNLVLNGYFDWYLPSKDELNKLYLNKTAVDGFASAYYWSSSEANNAFAWAQIFLNGPQFSLNKDYTNHVRAIRSF